MLTSFDANGSHKIVIYNVTDVVTSNFQMYVNIQKQVHVILKYLHIPRDGKGSLKKFLLMSSSLSPSFGIS